MFWRKRKASDFRKEIEAHIQLEAERQCEQGLGEQDARAAARRAFGNVMQAQEQFYESGRWLFWDHLWQDLRYALRRLRMAPLFTIATVLTLALGIGATTSIFTLVHAVLLKSLPVANPSELYRLGKESRCCFQGGYSQENEFSLVSYDLYRYLRDQTRGFSDLAAFPALENTLGFRRTGTPEAAKSYPGEFVSGNYFSMFGIRAYAGRVFTDADDQPNAPPVVVMSYRLWQQMYGSDPSVIGSVFNIDDKPFTVVGITPPGLW